MESNSNDDEVQPTIRIRFTISNNKDSTNSNDENYCDQTANQRNCNHQIDEKTKSGLFDHIDANRKQTDKKSAFRFIQPQNHKSSLFVNLSDTGSGNTDSEVENHLFISPDLNQSSPASPPSPVESIVYSTSSYEILGETSDSSITTDPVDDYTMNGCNFVNSLMSASRKRSASVTPRPQLGAAPPTKPANNGRRASSSDDLIAPEQNPLANKSSSGNHLAVGLSNETICDNDITQTNRRFVDNSSYVQLSAMNIYRPLQIDINDSERNSYKKLHGYSVPESFKHPVSIGNILQIDSEDRMEEDPLELERLVENWEKRVDELERERIAQDVPRTLVEKVLKQRKELRRLELECQLHKMDIEDSMCKESPSNRSKSQIRPGQENTADILEAIPPSGSFQHKQYLSKASTGTDFSEYSHVPIYDPHKHQVPTTLLSSDDSMSGCTNNDNIQRQMIGNRRHYQSHMRHHRVRCREQVYIRLDSPEVSHKPRSSPVRPNHFKDDFKPPVHMVLSHDSSSPASSGSPH